MHPSVEAMYRRAIAAELARLSRSQLKSLVGKEDQIADAIRARVCHPANWPENNHS